AGRADVAVAARPVQRLLQPADRGCGRAQRRRRAAAGAHADAALPRPAGAPAGLTGMDVSGIGTASWRHVGGQYLALTKPRIVMLAAFCALIGMLLAAESLVPWQILVFGTAGISLLAGAGFAFNCAIERTIDARMARTRARPLARGEVGTAPAIAFAGAIGLLGAV